MLSIAYYRMYIWPISKPFQSFILVSFELRTNSFCSVARCRVLLKNAQFLFKPISYLGQQTKVEHAGILGPIHGFLNNMQSTETMN